MLELFFIVFYIKLRTFPYIKLYITFNRRRSKYYHKKKKKKKTSNQRFSPGRARPSGRKSLYIDYVHYYVTQVRNFDTCVYISENKWTSPLKTMYGNFFFEIYIKFPTFWYLKVYKRANRKRSKYYHKKKKRQIKDFLPDRRARTEIIIIITATSRHKCACSSL